MDNEGEPKLQEWKAGIQLLLLLSPFYPRLLSIARPISPLHVVKGPYALFYS